jgi:hypothetical protein
MGMIFGFNNGAPAPVPEELQEQVTSSTTLSGGQSQEDTNGPITNRYETND